MAYFVTLPNGTVPLTAFTNCSLHGEGVGRKRFSLSHPHTRPPPFPPRTCSQNTNLLWAYYEPVGILLSGTGRPRKTMISKTLEKSLKNRISTESKNFFGKRHCLICRFGWQNNKNFVMGTLKKNKCCLTDYRKDVTVAKLKDPPKL